MVEAGEGESEQEDQKIVAKRWGHDIENKKELRADMNSNANYFRKELENIRSREKIENAFAKMKAEL